jgi:GMP synthase (glutamine-hydrolysing)
MRILLLNCDLDRSKETNGAVLLKLHLAKNRRTRVDVFDVCRNEFPETKGLAKYDGAVITGSRASVYEKKGWIRRLERLVRQIDRDGLRTLGICFGYQVVARALGGSVLKGDVYEEGFQRVSLTGSGKKDPVFDGFPNRFLVYQSHGDYIRRLPKGANLLSRNSRGTQAYRIRKFFCVQFHPEILRSVAIKMYRRDGKDVGRIRRAVAEGYSLPAKAITNFAEGI